MPDRPDLRYPTPLPFMKAPWLLLVSGLSFTVIARTAETAPTSRPNILWIVSEDNTCNYVGVYGDPLARTPHLARLAARGVIFDRAFSSAPVCAPSRASLITGMYAPSLGTQHMRSQVRLPGWLRYFPAYLRDAGYYTTNHAKTDYNAEVLPGTWDGNDAEAHWRHRKPGQPFFSVFNFAASHESSLHKRLPLETDPAKIRVPAYLPDTSVVRADFAQYYDRLSVVDQQIGELLAELDKDGLADNTIVFYFSDNGGVLPRSKRFVYRNGTHVALIVHWPAKFRHLAPASPGTHSDEIVNFVDFAPTVLSLTGVRAPDFFQGRAFAGAARVPAPEFTYTFRDRMDERYDLSRTVTDGRWLYIRNYHPELPTLQHLEYLWNLASMRQWDQMHRAGQLTAVQDACFQPKSAEELFDCRTDPDNVHNLASDPVYHDTLRRLRSANCAHLLTTRDSGFMPEPMVRALTSERPPADLAREDMIYPLARLIALIDDVQLSPAIASDKLAVALRDPLPVVRYWAAIGSLSAATPPDLAPLLHDDDPSVRIAAAFALLRHAEHRAAWQTLSDTLSPHASPEVRLAALNVITILGGWPENLRPIIAASDRHETGTESYVSRAAKYLLSPPQPQHHIETPPSRLPNQPPS